MPGPHPAPPLARCCSGHPIIQHDPQPPKCRPAAARTESGCGHSSSGVTGLETWAAGQGPGGAGRGSGRKAPSADWNKVEALGAQPGLIDLARCSSHRAGPAPGRLPVFPGVGTPWGNSFSCGYGVGLPPSTWGRPGRWGHAGSRGDWRLGIPQPANVRLLETRSRTLGSENVRIFAVRAHVYLSAHCVPGTALSTLWGLTPHLHCTLGGGFYDHRHSQVGKLRLSGVKQPA